jgi:phage tail P2-like protein
VSDDLALVPQQNLAPPGSTDPGFSLVEDLVALELIVSPPTLGGPTYRRSDPSAVSLHISAPFSGNPEFTQIPIGIALLHTNRFLGSQLLFRAATGFEKAMADTDSERLTSIDAELIRAIWSPYQCPVRLLPYLAWASGVEFWNDDWTETTKRAWINVQMLFKSLRGTRKAIEMSVDYAGRGVSPFGYKVLDVTTQPKKVFSGPSLTKAQREAWLELLPQVRVWRTYDNGYASEFKSFYGGKSNVRLHSRRFQLDGPGPGKLTAITPSTAITRLHRVAKWIVNGVETDIRVTDFGSYFRLHKASIEDGSVYSGRPFGLHRHYIPSTAHDRLITIMPTPTLPWRSSMTPSLQTVTSEPDRVKVAGQRKHQVFSDTPMHDFFVPSTASRRIFQRYAVLDASVRELRRTPVQFMGTGRYGFPNFTAWVDVSVAGKLNPKKAGYDFWLPKTKFYIPHDGRPVEQVRLAVQGAKALRDKIMLRIGPKPRFLAGERPVLAGIDTVLAGSLASL